MEKGLSWKDVFGTRRGVLSTLEDVGGKSEHVTATRWDVGAKLWQVSAARWDDRAALWGYKAALRRCKATRRYVFATLWSMQGEKNGDARRLKWRCKGSEGRCKVAEVDAR